MGKEVQHITEEEVKRKFATMEACLWTLLDLWAGDNRSCFNQYCPGGIIDYHYKKMKDRPAYLCTRCMRHFYPMKNTIFENSHIGLPIWIKVMFSLISNRTGISAKKIAKENKISYKTALRMTHQIRTLMGESLFFHYENTVVEIDETYVPTGSKGLGRHYKFKKGRGSERNSSVLGIVERSSGKKVVLIVIPSLDDETIMDEIKKRIPVESNALIVTDTFKSYDKLKGEGYKHLQVNHQKTFKNDMACTNVIEGVFSRLKRGIRHSQVKVTHLKLQHYCFEAAFRENNRDEEDYGLSLLLLTQKNIKRQGYDTAA